MLTEQNLCVQCYEPITNPVCEACHRKEVIVWLADTGLDLKTRTLILSEINKSLPREAMNENRCILCGKNTLSTCSYCFFFISARALKKAGVKKDLIKNFLEIFNYRIGHSEYAI